MPLLVPCGELQPGMRLAEPLIYHGRMMLAAGTALTASDVRSLQARFSAHSFRVGDPVLDAAIDFEDDSHEREVARTAQQKVAQCMTEVSARFSARATLDGVSVAVIQDSVADVIQYLKDNPVSAALLDGIRNEDNYLSEHAGNVFYLSMLLGAAARDYVSLERRRQTRARDLGYRITESLAPLGLGAMLMDIGMLPLQELLTGDEPLTPEAWAAVRDHPRTGAALLPEDFAAAAKTTVRTHHENVDGSGYPDGLAGGKLHIFTRIVRIADAFDAATASRVYEEAKSPVRVLWEMTVGPYRRFYDPKLVQKFARMIQPFPIGAKIRLRDGRYGVVVQHNREIAVAPAIIVAFDRSDRRLPNSQLDGPFHLGDRDDLRAASYAGEDLSFIYEAEQEWSHRSHVGVWPSLFEAAYP